MVILTRAQPVRTPLSPGKWHAHPLRRVVGPQIFRGETRPSLARRRPKRPQGSPRAIRDSHRYECEGALSHDASRRPSARAGALSRPKTSGPSARPQKATGPSLVAQRSARHTVRSGAALRRRRAALTRRTFASRKIPQIIMFSRQPCAPPAAPLAPRLFEKLLDGMRFPTRPGSSKTVGLVARTGPTLHGCKVANPS